ncbi:MAG: hypothetical protein J1E16_02980 [Muribaculaceae bacterium]|nr:hypothetical protein [Muribaculaceae bacterium]
MKMKKQNKFMGMTVVALATLGLVSCQNEFDNYVNGGKPANGDVSLVKAPDVVAWSGNQLLGSNGDGFTRAVAVEDYNWNFPADMAKVEKIIVPTEAAKYNKAYMDGGDYVVSGEHPDGILFKDNVNLNVYLAPGAKVKNIGNNISKLDLYIMEGAEFTLDSYSMNNCNIYNAGKLNLPKGFDGSRLQNIYNTGEVYIGEHEVWGKELPGAVAIYSKGGYIEFESSDESQNQYVYSETLINGTIVSDNIVKSNGKIKFQSNGYRDICHLISTDLIEIVDGTNIFGQITGTDIKFDGECITLHPEGYVYASNEINMPNSGCEVHPYYEGARGLVECKRLNIHMTNDPLNKAFHEGIYLQVEEIKDQTNGNLYTDFSGFELASPSHINQGIEITPSCASEGNPDEGNDDDDDEDDDDTNTDIVVENRHGNEVEVNYAILDKHTQYDVADLVTKLSIHVRKATDVEIVVPIPGKYFVESDDLYIFTDHANFVYNDEVHSVEYEIGGKTVTLTVAITEENITVTTTGIDQDVIDACWEANKDGINFEVYNYFQTAEVLWVEDVPTNIVRPIKDVNREELIGLMNQATIKFISDNPDYFINAFGANDDKTDQHDWHATVTPESDLFDLRYERVTHLNGTSYNYIWVRDGVRVDDYHKH